MFLEDGFTYNIKRALQDFIDDFDDPKQAVKAFEDGDHHEQFLEYLYERAVAYDDPEQLLIEMVGGKDAD